MHDQHSALLDLAAAAVEIGDENQWWSVVALAVLGPLFHADVMALNLLNVTDGIGWFSVVFPAAARRLIPVGSPMEQVLIDDHPFTRRLARGPVTQPIKVTDLVSPRQWRQLGSYTKMRELTGGVHHLTLHFTPRATHAESLSIVRSDSDFSIAEMELSRLLQPVLQVSLSHLRAVGRLRFGRSTADDDAALHAASELRISERERAVLELMDTGLTASAVGRALGVSERTVHKHQENLYRKLGVRDRLAALRAARYHLLLPDAPYSATSHVFPAIDRIRAVDRTSASES